MRSELRPRSTPSRTRGWMESSSMSRCAPRRPVVPARAHARGLPVFMHQHATSGVEAALAGVDSVEHVNVFGQLAPAGFHLAEPAKLSPFEYGGWLWRWLGALDPRSDAGHRLYDGVISTGTALRP